MYFKSYSNLIWFAFGFKFGNKMEKIWKKKKMISSSLPLPFRPAGPAPARSPPRRPIPFGLPLATLAAASSLRPVPTGPAKPPGRSHYSSPTQQQPRRAFSLLPADTLGPPCQAFFSLT